MIAPVFKRGGMIAVGDRIQINDDVIEVIGFDMSAFVVTKNGVELPTPVIFDNLFYYKIIN